jgi:hypothetical protein
VRLSASGSSSRRPRDLSCIHCLIGVIGRSVRRLARVGIDYHVEVEGFFHLVSNTLIREQVDTRGTARTIKTFHRGKHVAAHTGDTADHVTAPSRTICRARTGATALTVAIVRPLIRYGHTVLTTEQSRAVSRSRHAHKYGCGRFPTLLAAAGNPAITDELLKCQQLGDKTYKVHLDGYYQTDLITGQGPSKRHEIWYFAQTTLGAMRYDNYKYQFIDQPEGWIGPVVRPAMPKLTNLRQDPFERMNWPARGFAEGSIAYWDVFKYEMWRFQIPAQVIAQYVPSLVEYPPMQGRRQLQHRGPQRVEQAIAASKANSD